MTADDPPGQVLDDQVPDSLHFAAPSTEHDSGADARRARDAAQMVADLRSLGDELLGDLRAISAADADVPSLCPGWTVRDVVLHFVVGDRMGEAVLRGEDPFPDPTPDEEILMQRSRHWVSDLGEVPLDEAIDRFAQARAAMLDAIEAVADHEWGGYVPWGAEPIHRFSMVQSRLMETWVHGWDLRWPLAMPQPFDDRLWWISDFGARHVPYSLTKAGRPLPDVTLALVLSGSGGGSWERAVGEATDEVLEIAGPAWAWIAWATQRDPGRVGAEHLRVTPGPAGEVVMELARCFA